LKIQDGCDYSCTFCTIPTARGASRSHPLEIVVQEARSLAARGYKEIVLTGVNVGDYGRRLGLRGSGEDSHQLDRTEPAHARDGGLCSGITTVLQSLPHPFAKRV
jgi:tRNA A37 methylthiotransferase MiaB